MMYAAKGQASRPSRYVSRCVSGSSQLAAVQEHLKLYEHPLLAFCAREDNDVVEVLIELKNSTVPVHTYVLPIHARDLDQSQLQWHLQRQIYDGLHDYFIEMFTRTPQDRPIQRSMPASEDTGSQGR